MLSLISSYELSEWMVEFENDPFGDQRADARAAMIATTIANVFRGKRSPFKLETFMLKFGKRIRTMAEQIAKVEQLNAIFGGKDLRDRAD
jgi:hypothetical protein